MFSTALCVADEPTDLLVAVPGYTTHEVEGWAVRVSNTLTAERPEETERAMALLAAVR